MNIEQNLITDFSKLNQGDVVLTNKGSDLVVFKLLEKPRLSDKKHQYGTNGWNSKHEDGTDRQRYISVRCQIPVVTKSSPNSSYTWKQYAFRMPKGDDPIEKMDFNYKKVYRIEEVDMFNCD
tara:strand:- start:4770 stop:5135 length:366 start_codon:yes stop_codon:yes gene_type:complete